MSTFLAGVAYSYLIAFTIFVTYQEVAYDGIRNPRLGRFITILGSLLFMFTCSTFTNAGAPGWIILVVGLLFAVLMHRSVAAWLVDEIQNKDEGEEK